MPSTKSYRLLHNRVMARPGAAERLATLRKKTLAEVRLYIVRGKLRRLLTAARNDRSKS